MLPTANGPSPCSLPARLITSHAGGREPARSVQTAGHPQAQDCRPDSVQQQLPRAHGGSGSVLFQNRVPPDTEKSLLPSVKKIPRNSTLSPFLSDDYFFPYWQSNLVCFAWSCESVEQELNAPASRHWAVIVDAKRHMPWHCSAARQGVGASSRSALTPRDKQLLVLSWVWLDRALSSLET